MIVGGLLLGSYLLGAVPWSYLVVRVLRGTDVRTVGSGNAGATNVLRAAGPGAAAAVLVLDIAKGVAPVLLIRSLGFEPWLQAAAGLAAILGHVFPVFLGFRGGKGVATSAGVYFALAPWVALTTTAAFLAVVAVSRFVSLGSIVAAALFPVVLFGFERAGLSGGSAVSLPWAIAISALVIWNHRSNIRRLAAGQELAIGRRESRE